MALRSPGWLDLALVWGGLAFAIGSIIAVAPPVLFAVVQFESWQMPVLVLAGMTLIQFSIGNFLDPRIEGRALAISPFVVVASIFFWGLVWGIPGAFIGVPLTITLVTICNGFHQTCWLSRLLTPQAASKRLMRPTRSDERQPRSRLATIGVAVIRQEFSERTLLFQSWPSVADRQ